MPEAKASLTHNGPAAPTKRKFENDVNTGPDDATEAASSVEEQPKRAKIIGPTLPPRMDEASSHHSEEESDDSDDDYGPSLPDPSSTTTIQSQSLENELGTKESQRTSQSERTPTAGVTKRDDWMLRPPEQLDISSRVDPTKLRNRKFNTGSSARRNDPSAGGGPVSTWTETADEKRKRLENEVMGVQAPPSSAGALKSSATESSSAMKKQVREYNVRNIRISFVPADRLTLGDKHAY